MQLDVTSPRPLAEVALQLEQRFGCMVTYEDAPYRHPGDMTRDEGGRLIPRGGQIVVQYQPGDDLGEVLDKAIAVHARAGLPGAFAVQQQGGDYHIVPTGFRGADGAMMERTSLLNTTISLPSQPRTGLQLVEEMLAAVRAARAESVSPGILPLHALIQHVSRASVPRGEARDLLVGLFRDMGRRLSWQFLNDPSKAEFFLNIHPLPEREIQLAG